MATRRKLGFLAFVALMAKLAFAGGPEYVAGSSYFTSGMMGQPIVWSQGQIVYYTDQGDLSPILPNALANAFVGSAFNQWTTVPSAAIFAENGGQLAEDVNGSNIVVSSGGTITAPADITPSATQKPLAIVYDYDGTVTDALLGAGAGNPSQCFWNAVYGGADNFGTGANFQHALIVINGQCALQTSQLTDVEYRLVRVLGSVLGLGWSQLNLNVMSGDPPPTPADFAGFPVMHYMDLVSCVPITVCYPNPYQLAPDDMAALSRLYPVVSANPNTARVYGSVYFVDHTGAAAQPMQGVNVVAQWIDPATNLPSSEYEAASVSGFLFTGNAGNPITGLTDQLGNSYSEFGSSNQLLEGSFDLGGLPIPNNASTAQYQLTVEAVDPTWSAGVCPYDYLQVTPSGAAAPIIVTVSAGGEIEQNILMTGSAEPAPEWAATETWSAPASVPSPGDWVGSLDSYGEIAYFLLPAQANRTLSVAVTALDETGAASESKVQPLIGIWPVGASQGTIPPTLTPAPFNSSTFGMSLLDAQVLGSNTFIIGIADLRGDGRPDYHYHAHVLYGDSVSPARIPVTGGAITLQGTGLGPALTVAIGNTAVPILGTNSSQMLVSAPAQSDGLQTVTVTDPTSGASSVMTDVITFGAAATDQIFLLQGGNPSTPVGAQAANPVIVRVVESDGVTPVNGATVGWASTNNAAFSTCGGKTGCSTVTDESGIASTWVTPQTAGVASLAATLAPGVYGSTQAVAATLFATTPSSALALTPSSLWIAQGATVNVPLTAQVLNAEGLPQSDVMVNFTVRQGTGALSSPSATTNSDGAATVSLALSSFTGSVLVSACVAAGSPCQTVSGNAVAPSFINLQAVSGAGQIVAGTAFLPVAVRVTDSSTPPNPVLGAAVLFQSTVLRPSGDNLSLTPGDPGNSSTGAPAILSASQSIVPSDANGLASIVPSVGSLTGILEIEIQISAGTNASLQEELETFPQASSTGSSGVAALTGQEAPIFLAPPEHRILNIRSEEGP
jgi:hypothetical protein